MHTVGNDNRVATLWTAATGAVRINNEQLPEEIERLPIYSNEPTVTPTAGEIFWLDLCNWDNLQILLHILPGLHPLTLEDMEAGETREKCEAYGGYLFLSVHAMGAAGNNDYSLGDSFAGGTAAGPLGRNGVLPKPNVARNVYLLIFPHCLVTVHWDRCHHPIHMVPNPNPREPMNHHHLCTRTGGMPPMARILASRVMRVEEHRTASAGPDLAGESIAGKGTTADWLAYIVLDEIVDELVRQDDSLQCEVDAIEELALTLGRFDQADMIRRICAGQRRTTVLSRLIQPKIDLVRGLAKHGAPLSAGMEEEQHLHAGTHHLTTDARLWPARSDTPISSIPIPDANPSMQNSILQPRTLLYLRDVQDHLDSIRQNLAEYGEALDRAHGNFVGQADIELAMAGHNLNQIVQKLTTMTVIIGSTIAVSTIMGMNVKVPFQDGRPLGNLIELLPFFSLLLLMGLCSSVLFVMGRQYRWI